jgi:hypothetical protein
MKTATCRFCHGTMASSGERIFDYGQPAERIVARMFICKNCHSEQTLTPDNKLLDYDLFIPPYTVSVNPGIPSFTIKSFYPQGTFSYKTLLKLNHIPKNITPKTLTLDRIKLFLLFS